MLVLQAAQDIVVVVSVGALVQVCGIDACAVVAFVADAHTRREFTDVEQEGESVGAHLLTAIGELSIPCGHVGAGPSPAVRAFLDAEPEPCRCRREQVRTVVSVGT